ncbi:uncharacterized protein LOC123719007 isoform X1 [Pieris brassicae]|uniref:uncharacterized protein LOC123719007 isoform X1 n=1 Tax=Pieris brassicae TaxID=7116 RepID=UPI001E6605E2|nr:uncharacterized protein LOC123719007 isoform X1 [Pieris brassicae]XP_045532043.1 uncharacterized protein LOC123719007 isoform X1 [Pieris brassicae]XP_045532044.1 uncharacterized protein LOC123719007 isoform X1 [Pieris brassicae]
MLSYMVPVDEKPPPVPGKGRMALELAGSPGSPESTAKKRTNISKESSSSSFTSDLTVSSSTPSGVLDKPKHKLLNNGSKHTSLKRVSFGSSKGSMVETLIYESPLQEEPENSPPPNLQETTFLYTPVEDDSERSKVRVSFYQGARPQCLSPPPAQESHVLYATLLSAAANADMAEHVMYNRQISTESGWDNPFRPDGDLSREADEIVSLIKGGKPITPTPNAGVPLLSAEEEEEVTSPDNVKAIASPPMSPETKMSSPVQQSTPKAMNGTKNGTAVTEIRSGQVEVQRAPPQEPMQPEHVTIKPKCKKCKCCVVQ